MAKPGIEEEKCGEKRGKKLRSWILFIINIVIVIGGGANAIYRARGDRLDLINMVLMFSSLLGLIVLWGNLGWIAARVFEFGVVGQIVCPLVFVFVLLAFFLVLDKCCSEKKGSVIPIED